jgi:nitrate reductase gamma subunit
MRYVLFGLWPYLVLGLVLTTLWVRIRVGFRADQAHPLAPPASFAPQVSRLVQVLTLAGPPVRNRFRWAVALAFHYALLLVLVWHLRLLLPTIPDWFLALRQPARIAALILPGAVFGLLLIRLAPVGPMPPNRWTDLAVLGLILAVSGSGLALTLVFRANLVEIKTMVQGWVHLAPYLPQNLASPRAFLVHYLAGTVLLVMIPRFPLVHGLGFLFRLTRPRSPEPFWGTGTKNLPSLRAGREPEPGSRS